MNERPELMSNQIPEIISDRELYNLASCVGLRDGLVAELVCFLRQIRSYHGNVAELNARDWAIMQPIVAESDRLASIALYDALSRELPHQHSCLIADHPCMNAALA